MAVVHTELATRFTSISDTPALDASVLLAHIVHKPRTWVLAHPELMLTPEQQTRLDSSLVRIENGEPFPYVLGKWEFFGLELEVNADVLIPRPETELLVEKAIAWLQEQPHRRNIADIGTGSGAIAIAIAAHIKDAHIFATDISPAALNMARRNAQKFNLANIDFVECDLLPQYDHSDASQARFDLICANLPYIPTDTLRGLPIFNREPSLALDGGSDGLEVVRRLLHIAPQRLETQGLLLLEIEATCGVQVLALASELFPRAAIQLYQDLTGRDRLLEIQT